jgi:hypothetical protein
MARHPTGPPDREHASLHTIAGLVAGGATAPEVFAVVAREVARVTGSAMVQIQRFTPGDTISIAGAWGADPHPFQVGTRWNLEGSEVAATVRRTGIPWRQRRPSTRTQFSPGADTRRTAAV